MPNTIIEHQCKGKITFVFECLKLSFSVMKIFSCWILITWEDSQEHRHPVGWMSGFEAHLLNICPMCVLLWPCSPVQVKALDRIISPRRSFYLEESGSGGLIEMGQVEVKHPMERGALNPPALTRPGGRGLVGRASRWPWCSPPLWVRTSSVLSCESV